MASTGNSATLTPPVGDRDHAHGPTTAAVTLVEYGDYECPSCGRAYPILRGIRQHFGPRLRFVFRNFPLVNSHPHAQHAAEAAEAAAALGRFWEMHDMLFEHQHALDDRHLGAYAETIDLDRAAFEQELASGRPGRRVHDDFVSGVDSGVGGTPTFFINGVHYRDSWDEETLLGTISKILRRP